ncbi:MAG: imidazoleglycerol-phosphate dehydratase HisB [Spirochaetaceae bacterium]|jgi:imidazoleglycerol-phosphate dehydratase|nr:imidazoleglycerol-phosphate dehydratase HisB [Spirochaetaceae bacterium]
MSRIAERTRKTGETAIYLKLNLDGRGEAKLDYPIGFMAHMLSAFAKHGLFDLEIRASGDLEVDQHHLVEDTGITLGQCFAEALGEKRGIRRAGSCLYPMDETLARAAVDISGRAFLVFEGGLSGIPLVQAPERGVTLFQTDTVEDFWQGFAAAAGLTLHLETLRGRSDHHKIEALFKAAARALREASEIDVRAAGDIPSTKGILGETPRGVVV